ncbi:MAG: ABC transporter ATP-binding protein [Proteobacteria bacterium]|nr:ABC transporter ATP-binding protein [Pseudomonadota bacterium]
MIERLLRDYVGPRKGTLILAVLCMAGGAAMTGGLAWLLDPAIKYIFLEKRADMLVIIPAALVAVVFLRAVFNYGEGTLSQSIGQGIVSDTQRDMFRNLVGADLQRLNAVHSGQFVSNFLYDATLLREAVVRGIAGLGREFLALIFLAGVMIYQNWRLALISVFVLPVIGWAARQLGKRMRKATAQSMKETGELSSMLAEILDGRRIVKAYALEEDAVLRANKSIDRRLNYLLKAVRARALSVPVADFLGGIAIAAVVLDAGYESLQGRLELNQFASFLGAMLLVQQPVRSLSQLWSVTTEGLGAAQRVFAVIDAKPRIVDAPGAQPVRIAPPPLGTSVRFRDVRFAYQEGAPALDGITLEIPAGKKVALVGPSGSGKSTVFNLFLRFYEVDSGSIEINGQNISSVTMKSLRHAIALVTQEAFLFDDTIRANIGYGRPGANAKDIEAAAKAAAAHEFISALPSGYETRVGEGGLRLSGGERQRVAIARAMLRNAPILLLDEATSALDTENERIVQNALRRLMKGRTTIVIAHRLTTVLDADHIYVLDQGRVAEQGNHEELLARGGLYARLFQHDIREADTGHTANFG